MKKKVRKVRSVAGTRSPIAVGPGEWPRDPRALFEMGVFVVFEEGMGTRTALSAIWGQSALR
jgi:hypothetical protein